MVAKYRFCLATAMLWMGVGVPGMVVVAAATIVEVEAGSYDRVAVPLHVVLPADLKLPAHPVLVDPGGWEVAVQLESGQPRRLWWMLEQRLPRGTSRRYVVRAGRGPKVVDPAVRIVDTGRQLQVAVRGKRVLSYNHAVVPSPDPARPYFERSGFIHPVWSPAGHVVTDAMPADHLHQHGLMFAWTNTSFQNTPIDFWNSALRQGRVEHQEIIRVTDGPVFAEMVCALRHLDITDPDSVREALVETWKLRIYARTDTFLFDLESEQRAATAVPLVIHEYHYGGMMIRGAAHWAGEGGAQFITSDGKTRIEGNHTRPNWVDIRGPAEAGSIATESAGILAMGGAANFRYPQPVRLHPSMPYFCFAPLVLGEFRIEQTVGYVSRFRLAVHDGELPSTSADGLWHDFAEAPVGEIANDE